MHYRPQSHVALFRFRSPAEPINCLNATSCSSTNGWRWGAAYFISCAKWFRKRVSTIVEDEYVYIYTNSAPTCTVTQHPRLHRTPTNPHQESRSPSPLPPRTKPTTIFNLQSSTFPLPHKNGMRAFARGSMTYIDPVTYHRGFPSHEQPTEPFRGTNEHGDEYASETHEDGTNPYQHDYPVRIEQKINSL